MSSGSEQSGSSSVRLWCVAASDAPVVAVIARVYGERQWTCLLRWNWKEGTVEEGAWTTMSIAAHRCRLSPDGEFLFYHAKGGSNGPFTGLFGGAFAVSRLPWLSALTDPTTFGPAGSWESRDALADDEQRRLWALFEGWPAYLGDEHWPRQLGHAWIAKATDDARGAEAGLERAHLAAKAEVPDTGLHVYAVVRSRTDKAGWHHWDLWHDDLKFFVGPTDEKDTPLQEVTGARWVSPASGGRLLVATSDARVKMLRFKYKTGAEAAYSIDQEHDLAALVPRPGPAPRWAKERLA